MQPNNATPSAANLIPAAHIPQAVAAASQNKNPGVMSQLQAMQAQLNALMGVQQQENLGDVILVNSTGRIVEVEGKQAVELLSKPGFRKATTDEEERYRRAIIRQTPQYLRRMESKRLADEQKLLDEIEAEDDSTGAESIEDLLKAPVTDAQTSGTPAPATPAAPAAGSQTTQTTQTANDAQTNTGTESTSTPKPPSRREKAAGSQTTTDTNNTNKTDSTSSQQ